jgi:hypothetical protein
MSNQLDPKELARIKRLGRADRIRRIRRAAAVTGVSLAAAFSGMVLVRTELDQPSVTTAARVAETTVPSEPALSGDDRDEHESDHPENGLVGAIAEVVGDVMDGSGAPQAESAPAAPLTTSQS